MPMFCSSLEKRVSREALYRTIALDDGNLQTTYPPQIATGTMSPVPIFSPRDLQHFSKDALLTTRIWTSQVDQNGSSKSRCGWANGD